MERSTNEQRHENGWVIRFLQPIFGRLHFTTKRIFERERAEWPLREF
jgi:hypothetical protein